MFRPIHRFGILTVPSSRKYKYSFIHSDDLVDALIASAEEGKRVAYPNDGTDGFEQGCYSVGYSPPITYCEFGSVVGRAVGRKRVRSVRALDIFVRFGGRVTDVYAQLRRQPQIFSYDKAREAVAGSWTCSTELIETECGFHPAYSFAERVQQTADWLLENGWLRARRHCEEDRSLEKTLA